MSPGLIQFQNIFFSFLQKIPFFVLPIEGGKRKPLHRPRDMASNYLEHDAKEARPVSLRIKFVRATNIVLRQKSERKFVEND